MLTKRQLRRIKFFKSLTPGQLRFWHLPRHLRLKSVVSSGTFTIRWSVSDASTSASTSTNLGRSFQNCAASRKLQSWPSSTRPPTIASFWLPLRVDWPRNGIPNRPNITDSRNVWSLSFSKEIMGVLTMKSLPKFSMNSFFYSSFLYSNYSPLSTWRNQGKLK